MTTELSTAKKKLTDIRYRANGVTSTDLDTVRKQFLEARGFDRHTTDARYAWLRSIGLQG